MSARADDTEWALPEREPDKPYLTMQDRELKAMESIATSLTQIVELLGRIKFTFRVVD